MELTIKPQDENFKDLVRANLTEGTVTVTFTKKDGTNRVMKCTTNPTLIMFKDPKILEAKGDRKVNEEVMPVYDIEANGWRSFRWDSVTNVIVQRGEDETVSQ